MIVVSEKLYTPQQFVEVVTGHCCIFNGDDDVGRISAILEENGYGYLWDYTMSDIDHIVEQGHQVVLVDCMVWSEGKGQYEHEYRWWQVPDNALNKFQNKEEN
jgi:hypothetical protein